MNKIKVSNDLYINRHLPKNIISDDFYLFKNELTKFISATYYINMKKVFAFSDTVVSLLPIKFFYKETFINGYFSFSQKYFYVSKIFTNNFISINKAVWITQNWTWMYFHWVTDALTRLISVIDVIDDHLILIPDSYQKYNFVKESLDLLNIKYYWVSDNDVLSVKELILTSHTAPTGNYNVQFINEIRNYFTFCSSLSRKIYISRKKVVNRNFENETEVENLVLKYGFEIFYFEELSFKDQIQIMNQSAVLFGMHGGGLTNMVFMPSGGKVLEIRLPKDDHNNCYFSLASALDHEYYYLESDIDQSSTGLNFKVDIDKLDSVLKMI